LHLSGKGVWRMIIMTISTLLIAFAVMFFTKADDPAKIESFDNSLKKKALFCRNIYWLSCWDFCIFLFGI
jgi:hypothetical protein